MGRRGRAMTIHRSRSQREGGRPPPDRRISPRRWDAPAQGIPEMVLTAAQTILCLVVVGVVFTTQFLSPPLYAKMGEYFQAVMGRAEEPIVEVGVLDQPITWEAFMTYWEQSAAQVAWADPAGLEVLEEAKIPRELGVAALSLPTAPLDRQTTSSPQPWGDVPPFPGGWRVAGEEPAGAGGENPWVPDNLYTGPVVFSAQAVYPAYGNLSSPFGVRRHPITGQDDFHTGIDIAGQRGDGIYAVLPGVVEEVGESPIYGFFLKLRHSPTLVTVYCHCDRVLAQEGARLRQGERVAEMGSTGISTGNHLHFEVRVNGSYIDPMGMFAS